MLSILKNMVRRERRIEEGFANCTFAGMQSRTTLETQRQGVQVDFPSLRAEDGTLPKRGRPTRRELEAELEGSRAASQRASLPIRSLPAGSIVTSSKFSNSKWPSLTLTAYCGL